MNPLSLIILAIVWGIGLLLDASGVTAAWLFPLIGFGGLYLASAPRIANQWERAVVLRLGKYVGLRGPGPYFVIPGFDVVNMVIDNRVRTTTFMAEKTLTKDTVPVDVDAVLFLASL